MAQLCFFSLSMSGFLKIFLVACGLMFLMEDACHWNALPIAEVRMSASAAFSLL
jgi:hypothetical protein